VPNPRWFLNLTQQGDDNQTKKVSSKWITVWNQRIANRPEKT